MKWGDADPGQVRPVDSLRLIGQVGEPINPEAYIWYRETIGGDRCPVVDTWWQTETGSIMISPLPGVTAGKPGAAMTALPGRRRRRRRRRRATRCRTAPAATWCSPSRGRRCCARIWGDDERFKETYWSRFPGLYFAGDGAKKDEDGDIWLLGRVDDVMNVSGHRLSTTEIESALVSHPKVAEAAVVGAADDMTGQAVVAFVILRGEAGDGGPDVVEGAARPRRQGDRPDRPAAPDHGRRRAAQDPLRQDHAPPAAGRRGEPRGRRRHDAGRLDGHGRDQGGPGQRRARTDRRSVLPSEPSRRTLSPCAVARRC